MAKVTVMAAVRSASLVLLIFLPLAYDTLAVHEAQDLRSPVIGRVHPHC